MSRKISGRGANDNAPRERRKVVSGLAPELPVSEFELVLVETHIGNIIEKMLPQLANDNTPKKAEGDEP